MVNRVLHDYVQGLRRRMVHIPLRVQRRLVNEVVAHLEADVVALRREHAEWSPEEATEKAIDAFCPLDDALPLYGPEEGLIRRSSAEWIVRAPQDQPKRTSIDGRRWGAAAAGLAAVALVAAIALMGPTGQNPDPLGVEQSPGDVLDAWWFTNMTGGVAAELHVPVIDGFVLTVDGGGCLNVSLVAPDGTAYDHVGCVTEPWTIEAPMAGDWLVSIDGDAFTGTLTATVG